MPLHHLLGYCRPPPHNVIFLKRPPNYSGKLLHARVRLHLCHVVLCFLILCFDKIEIKNCLPFEIVNAPFTFIAKFAIIWPPGSEETGNTSKKIVWQFGQCLILKSILRKIWSNCEHVSPHTCERSPSSPSWRQILQPRLHSSARLSRQSYISPKREGPRQRLTIIINQTHQKQEHLVRSVSITHVRVDVSQNFQLVPDDCNV